MWLAGAVSICSPRTVEIVETLTYLSARLVPLYLMITLLRAERRKVSG
jgi:hypothetical protein